MNDVIIRFINKNEYEDWALLYKQYLDFYQTSLSSEALAKLWSWLLSQNQSLFCYVAESKGKLVGLAHFREYIRPIKAEKAIFLDDLFVTDAARGQQVGYRLIEAVKQYARTQNFSLVRWITAHDNVQAINLYDSIANKTLWVTYDAPTL